MTYTHHTLRWIARIGYGARGVVYLAFGAVVVRAAWYLSEAEDVRGTMHAIHDEPGGAIGLIGIAAGLLAYSIWRFVQSLLDVDGHGWRLRGLSVRLALLVSAATHASLAWAGIRIAMEWGDPRSKPVQQAVSEALSLPGGRALVAIGGIVILAAGVAHFYKAATAGFRRWFAVSPGAMWWIDPVSRIGLTARGLMFVGIGGFIVYSAVTLHAADAKGVQGLLEWVRARVYGQLLLGSWAIGMMLFGGYSLIEAFVRRVGLDADTEAKIRHADMV